MALLRVDLRVDLREAIEAAACALIAALLSTWSVRTMPQGGTATLEMAPVIILTFLRGTRAGVISGALTGILTFFIDGYMETPMQAFIDYPLAFGCIGIGGMWRDSLFASSVMSSLMRLACHILSGVVYFGEYAPAGQSPLAYSVIYNGSYMVPSMAASVSAAWVFILGWKLITYLRRRG